MSLADRLWDDLMTRQREASDNGPIIDHVQIEANAEDQIDRLVSWLADKAVTLFEEKR
jgi:hypothetical protein